MIKKIILVASILVVLNPILVQAQLSNPLPATRTATVSSSSLPVYSGVDGTIGEYLCTPTGDGKDLERCINRLYRFGITAGALVLVAMVVFAGYLYITSGETGKTKAKGIIMNSLVGMAILLGSYALLYFINPSLVAFRTIQPPIFDAEDLPDCATIGFGDSCIYEGDESAAIAATGRGSAIACPDGLVNYDKSVPANSNPSSAKICSAFMEKLKLLHAKHKITVTSTIRNSATQSNCHRSNTGQSGACADISSNSGDWDGLCKAVKEVGGLGFLNESAQSSTNCGKFVKTKYWTGPHLHVNLVGA